MGTDYDKDFAAWVSEYAALLRAGRLGELDAEHRRSRRQMRGARADAGSVSFGI